jgi:hypothetical protein
LTTKTPAANLKVEEPVIRQTTDQSAAFLFTFLEWGRCSVFFSQPTESMKANKIEWKNGKRTIYGQDSGYKIISVANKPSQEAVQSASDFL